MIRSTHLPLLITLATFIVAYALCASAYPAMLSLRVVANLLTDNAFLGIAAVGMTFVILSGGIDLSIPATAVLCAGIVAVITTAGLSLVLAAGAALVACMLVGGINALLVTLLRMTPLLTTLAMFVAVVGINNVITSRRRLDLTSDAIASDRVGRLMRVSKISK